VAHLRRSHGTPGQAGSTSITTQPCRTGLTFGTGPPGLGVGFSSAVLSRRELMRLWHCQHLRAVGVKLQVPVRLRSGQALRYVYPGFPVQGIRVRSGPTARRGRRDDKVEGGGPPWHQSSNYPEAPSIRVAPVEMCELSELC
jgi:hypothetical protein